MGVGAVSSTLTRQLEEPALWGALSQAFPQGWELSGHRVLNWCIENSDDPVTVKALLTQGPGTSGGLGVASARLPLLLLP